MRMISCNGCRILRKGCNEDCILRPCLDWIKSPESQANATVFLAKFYGRAGLLNLINAAPLHHRSAIFRSLLFEACGRIINPIYGSVGLLSSGSWEQCQLAVDSVLLNGSAILQLPSDRDRDGDHDNDNAAVAHTIMSLKDNCDIRHLSKGNATHDRRSTRGVRGKAIEDLAATGSPSEETPAKFSITGWRWEGQGQGGDHYHNSFSVGTVVEPTSAQRDQGSERLTNENCEVLLELTLGWN